MSFNRVNYDQNAYKQDLNQSVGPGMYYLARPKVSCEPCYPYAPSVRLDKAGDSVSGKQSLIDVDSELMNITRKYSKDPREKYIPSCPDAVSNSGECCAQGVVSSCKNHVGPKPGSELDELKHFPDCFFNAEDTRLSNPSCNLRGTGWNRWEWLCKNPQDRVQVPFDWNINNRLVVKDNHRPCIPKLIDQSPALPRGGKLPCETTSTVCAPYTIPASVNWQTADVISKY
jgi:hypothetical protein